MKDNNQMQQFYKRLCVEAFLKSLFAGLAIGFAANFAVALITWFFPVDGLWISIAVGVGVCAASCALFYFLRFRPTPKDVAIRLDELGYDERYITMLQFENDDAPIIAMQRQEAQVKLSSVKSKHIKLAVPAFVLILAFIGLCAGVAMTTVTALSSNGKIIGGAELVGGSKEEYISVDYMVEGGGYINGDEMQLVLAGEATETVVAVADEGWVFDSWDDGLTNPSRSDQNITEARVITAIFVELGEGGDGVGSDGDDISDSDEEPDEQPDSDDGDNSSGDGSSESGSGSGKYEENNQIIDGETYYRDVYEQYYEEAMKALSEDEEIPDWLREIIESYFNIIL